MPTTFAKAQDEMNMTMRLQTKSALALVMAGTLAVGTALADDKASEPNPVIENLLTLKSVSELSLSPDGKQAVYVVTSDIRASDEVNSDIWLLDVATGATMALTHTTASEWSPQWRADGQTIGFLSDRHDPDAAVAQVWLLSTQGGEARKVTDFVEGVEDYVFAPAGEQLALMVTGPDPFAAAVDDNAITTAPPVVIDRFAFKADGYGYLTRESELYLFDIASGESTRLAQSLVEPMNPAFSPDGKQLAIVGRVGEKPDRGDNYDVFITGLKAGSKPRVIVETTTAVCNEQRPQWSPDGRYIACGTTLYDEQGYYAQYELALLDTRSGTIETLTEALDLNVYSPHFSADGKSIYVSVEDDMMQRLARIDIATLAVTDVYSGKFQLNDFDLTPEDRVVATITDVTHPAELYLIDGDERIQLSHHNDAMLAALPWQDAEAISFNSPDGTEVHGLLMRPAGYERGKRYPTVLWIHGGPTSQFSYSGDIDPQVLAAHGYAVVMLNPRGSTGRGLEYARVLTGAWGSVDVPDVLAGVDHVVAMGVAHPDKLYVGGWSYGGMLTNYVIASDTRFQAAVSGAGIGNAWAGFGTDMYVHEYLSELGRPWDNPEGYNRVSYPFMHADRIETPTIFMVGANDYNVPALASEQMYQALRVLEVPTRLVIYPGQSHGLHPPSYRADFYQRVLDWYEHKGRGE
jgi:dipeptidyl aminopeptidase/acylaminoacyl peptidase